MTKAKTYVDLLKQIDALQREADSLRKAEIDGVIARIKEAIAVYGLTAKDLGLTEAATDVPAPRRQPGVPSVRTSGSRPVKPARAAKPARPIKFRDEGGNVWSGRGPRPKWIREALAAGKQLEDFAT